MTSPLLHAGNLARVANSVAKAGHRGQGDLRSPARQLGDTGAATAVLLSGAEKAGGEKILLVGSARRRPLLLEVTPDRHLPKRRRAGNSRGARKRRATAAISPSTT
jgi:hypothetical protein